MANAPDTPRSEIPPRRFGCPRCGTANDVHALCCRACGDTLHDPTRPWMTPAGYGRRNAILAMIGIVYHPLLILLAPVVIESLGLYSPMLLPLALGAFLILPVIAAIVVHASSGIRDRFRLSARLTFSLGMIWLPMAAGWFVLTLSQC